jgi:cell division protein FtsB
MDVSKLQAKIAQYTAELDKTVANANAYRGAIEALNGLIAEEKAQPTALETMTGQKNPAKLAAVPAPAK